MSLALQAAFSIHARQHSADIQGRDQQSCKISLMQEQCDVAQVHVLLYGCFIHVCAEGSVYVCKLLSCRVLGRPAAQYNTWLLIKLTLKGVLFPLSFLFLSCRDITLRLCWQVNSLEPSP